MSDAKHTAGEWTVAKGGRSVNVGPHAKCRFEAGLPLEELAANCALIAMAPELLRLLDDADGVLRELAPGHTGLIADIAAAIAKARGGA